MASVVGKTIFSDGKGKLYFGYYKDDDGVTFVDYKTWKKLSFKDVSKGDTNKERVIKAILKNQKQFNKKVDFNIWSKKNNPSFEQKMDWFIQNGWINNINKGGIKEGAGDINKAPIPSAIKVKLEKALDVLDGKKLTYPQKLQVLGRVLDSMGIDKGELNKVTQKLRTKLESVNEYIEPQTKKIASLTGTRPDAVKQFVSSNALNITKLLKFIEKGKLSDRMDFVTALAGKPGNPIQKKVIKMFSESVNEDTKKRFDVDFYKSMGDRQTSHEEIIRGDKFSDVVEAAQKILKAKKYEYAEFYYKDKFLGSIHKSIHKFKPGRDYKSSPISVFESVTEGKKRFNTKYGVGKSKYVVNYHDGKKKHKDGSDFFDIQIFKNQKDLDTFKKALLSKGFVQEGVNEAKFGYKDSTASYIKKHNNEYKIAEKINKGNEMKFYDELQKMEDKIGHPKFMIFVSNALRGYGVDMYKDPKIKTPQDAQEALFLLSK